MLRQLCLTSLILVVLCAAGKNFAASVGSAFTYQGRLNDGGSPASGVYDFEFGLHSQPTGATEVVPGITVEDVTVTGGLFTVSLDFGSSAFDGEERYLYIGVRPGASVSSHTALSPRQRLSATPYASYALNAEALSGLTAGDFVPTGSTDTVDATMISNPTRMIDLPSYAWRTSTGVSTYTSNFTGTVNGVPIDSFGVNLTSGVGTAGGKLQVCFSVPPDYISGGTLRVVAQAGAGDNDLSAGAFVRRVGNSSPLSISFGSVTDADLGLTGTYAITFTPAAALVAGDQVTIAIGRTGGTGTCSLIGTQFQYTAAQ